MAGARDIDSLLKGWDFQPGEVSARLVKARNGRDVIQMRVDMGVLQSEEIRASRFAGEWSAETEIDEAFDVAGAQQAEGGGKGGAEGGEATVHGGDAQLRYQRTTAST